MASHDGNVLDLLVHHRIVGRAQEHALNDTSDERDTAANNAKPHRSDCHLGLLCGRWVGRSQHNLRRRVVELLRDPAVGDCICPGGAITVRRREHACVKVTDLDHERRHVVARLRSDVHLDIERLTCRLLELEARLLAQVNVHLSRQQVGLDAEAIFHHTAACHADRQLHCLIAVVEQSQRANRVDRDRAWAAAFIRKQLRHIKPIARLDVAISNHLPRFICVIKIRGRERKLHIGRPVGVLLEVQCVAVSQGGIHKPAD